MTRIRYGIAISCLALLAAGCGGGGATMQSTAGEAAPAQSETPAIARAQESDRTPQRQESGADGVVSDVTVTRQERQVIYTGSMTVRARQVATAAQQAKQIVTEAGGYLNKEESDSAGGTEDTALLEFKVPPAKYAEVLGRLGKELGRQLSLQQATQDVTLQVADVESRLKSAQQSLESLRELLERADTIGQVLDVEREISAREADLESLQAQQKELAAQVSMATLTLRLVGPVAVVEDPSEEPAGFLGGLKAGWQALVSVTKTALTVLGALVPWLAVLLPPVALVVLLVRRGRRHTPPPAPAPDPEAG
ncbi:DUF4349 domain-containing protein [Nonomuraea aridisoli]|nr:DUF4349 domain-containing protein [Nonomuraea aridisoli]